MLYTQRGVLRDGDMVERQRGIAAGLAWLPVADATVIYTDRGVSPGMRQGIEAARAAGITVKWRSLDKKRHNVMSIIREETPV